MDIVEWSLSGCRLEKKKNGNERVGVGLLTILRTAARPSRRGTGGTGSRFGGGGHRRRSDCLEPTES